MAKGRTAFHDYLKEEISKYQGIYVPVKASLLQRLLVRRAKCGQLHPNPDDEFCYPEIGPNEEIISRYVEQIKAAQRQNFKKIFHEAITVQKIRPDGYLILNGHHRWAAAYQWRLPSVPIQIVNLTQPSDLQEMFRNAKSDKRVTFDLDEVVFCPENATEMMEKPPRFPMNAYFKERLYLGIPALFDFFRKNGYDVWVYSKNYYSMDYIRHLFQSYHVYLSGIVTGTKRKHVEAPEKIQQIEKQMKDTYKVTLHVDRESLVWVDNRSKSFRE